MPGFDSPEGDLTANLFLSETEILEFNSGGSLFLWGRNNYGQFGDNTTTNKSFPVQTISGGTNWKQVSGGYEFSAAIKTDGTLWTWGTNGYGQLGDNTTVNKSSPVQTVAGGTNWKQVSAGRYSAAAIKTDGTLWGWGDNGNGELGDNTTTRRSSPVQTVAGGTNWRQVVRVNQIAAAIKTDGTLWLWGANAFGVLGDNTNNNRSSPVQTVAGGTNWKSLPYPSASVGSNMAAIKTDGTLWVWGSGSFGRLGTNDTTARSSPVQTVAGGTNWKQVAIGSSICSAIKTDGTLWTWGENQYGEIGDNTRTNRSSPVQTVTGGTNWKEVTVGVFYCSAIKTDGTLWSWGRNNYGILGDNTTTHRSSPVQTVAGGNNWKQSSAGARNRTVIQFSVALP